MILIKRQRVVCKSLDSGWKNMFDIFFHPEIYFQSIFDLKHHKNLVKLIHDRKKHKNQLKTQY